MSAGRGPNVGPPGSRRWTLRHAILLVGILSLTVRLWCLGSVPLVITNDGAEYLAWGEGFYTSNVVAVASRPDRTPGYPILLGLVFHCFGVGPVGVLVVQHLLGCVTCVLVAVIATCLGGPVMGTLSGILCALDPWLLSYESYVLTATPAATLGVLAVTLAVCCRRPRLISGLALGLVLGTACLVRPSFQVFVPFCLLGWLVSLHAGRGRVTLAALAAVVGLALPVVPWLRVNKQRYDRYVLASGSGAHLWSGLARVGLIDPDFPLEDERVAQAYAPFAGGPLGDAEFWSFCKQIDGLGSHDRLLRDWAWASIRAHPRPYLETCGYALGWQLNYHAPSGAILHDELNWFVRRLGADGSNFCFEAEPGRFQRFAMDGRGGPPRRFLRWWADAHVPGVPQIPLFLCALLMIVLALLRRHWGTAIVFAGTVAFLMLHAALLFPNSRYALPMWIIWYAAVGVVPAWIAGWIRGGFHSRRAGGAADGTDRITAGASTSQEDKLATLRRSEQAPT